MENILILLIFILLLFAYFNKENFCANNYIELKDSQGNTACCPNLPQYTLIGNGVCCNNFQKKKPKDKDKDKFFEVKDNKKKIIGYCLK